MVTLVSFVAILWALSGPFTVPWVNVTVPGYMVWAALLYAIVGTWLTNLIGRPLVRLELRPAALRGGLPVLRSYAFARTPRAWRSTTARRTSCADFRERFGHGRAELVGHHAPAEAADLVHRGLRPGCHHLPLRGRGARYFRGEFALGGLMQTASAFGQVQDSLSFIISRVHRHRRVARGGGSGWRASTGRSTRCAPRPPSRASAVTRRRAGDLRRRRCGAWPRRMVGLVSGTSPSHARPGDICAHQRAFGLGQEHPVSGPSRGSGPSAVGAISMPRGEPRPLLAAEALSAQLGTLRVRW